MFLVVLALFAAVLLIFAFANWTFLGSFSEDKPLAAFSYGLIVNSAILAIGSIFFQSGEGYALFGVLFLVGLLSLWLSQMSAR